MSFIKFPSIEQYRHVIEEVQQQYRYQGRDGNGKPMYDTSALLPTLTFHGSVKLHGTNAGVCLSKQHGIYAQSRNRVLSVGNDNAGFCAFVKPLEPVFQTLMQTIKFDFDGGETLAIFGEWCGEGIMKGVGIAKLPKMFVVFAAAVQGKGGEDEQRWLGQADLSAFKSPENRIYNILDYDTFTIDVDFNKPEMSQARLTEITDQVERQCPVAFRHGISGGTGEGVVWTATASDGKKIWRFKVKGDEHAVTKTKQPAPIAAEKQASLAEFVTNVVTKNRLEQGIAEVFTAQNKKASLADTAAFLRWMQNDVLKEERDTIKASDLEEAAALKAVGDAARKWFKEHCTMRPSPALSLCCASSSSSACSSDVATSTSAACTLEGEEGKN